MTCFSGCGCQAKKYHNIDITDYVQRERRENEAIPRNNPSIFALFVYLQMLLKGPTVLNKKA